MTNSALQATCAPFEHCLGIIRQASVEILLLLGVHVAEGKDPRWFLEQLDQARLNLGGWGAVARRLQMNDAQLSQFTLRLRHLQQSVPQYESGQDVSENQLISALRFVAALEQLRQQQPLLNYQTDIEIGGPDAQMRAQRQLRAIELTLKALVARVWPDQHPLNSFLKQHFGAERLRRWLKLGEGRDALDGMLFSELALMVVDKKLFVRHFTQIFNDTSVLMLFVEPRLTLRMFLDDCRLARNAVIAQQPLTSVQLMLLNYQYQQITHSVQRAFEERRTRINPASYLDSDESTVRHFWETARQKDEQAGGDKMEIADSIDPPEKRAQRTAEEREQLISGMLWVAVGVMVLAISLGAFWLFNAPAPQASSGQTVEIVQEEPRRDAPSARESVTRMGITWDTFNMRAAIDRNDTRVTSLFLQGGMDWKLAWTEQAFSAGNTAVLKLLLRYPSQMDEAKPCQQFMNTLSHAMSNGASLTSLHKSYLHSFCSTPEVVARQQYDVEQAQLRVRADPNAENKKWQKIHTALYDAIN
ncbi:STY4199 family HEPN domain-containing protein [Citrobacter sp. Igbk 16]|uniref:STY4199 family HEPN domain-containing protein n=1 Tax=Citrobacter sp. Igbk 16 TaxID=2963958 RepID=UPI00230446EE|nr:STY4199 family HEPN domain-containing protein [Citrobacter sp. Igbk 16]MDA8515296.1 STY4199 family HEPN domain-containing protein [Citrobacter sp. Igbk 16]